MMETRKSGDFLSHGMWLKSVVTEDVILCGVSALEYMGLFTGYLNESSDTMLRTKKGHLPKYQLTTLFQIFMK